jgi:hypothetical protein
MSQMMEILAYLLGIIWKFLWARHVLFDTGRRRTRLGILKKTGEPEQ